jgi:hypothetical protein
VRQRGRRLRRVSIVSVMASLIACATIALPASASPRLTFAITIGDTCFSGTARAAGSVLAVRVNTPGGQAKGFGRTRIPSNHHYRLCFGSAQSIVGLLPGDVVIARVGDFERRWSVPPLEPLVDRDTDLVSGRTAPNAPVEILVQAGWVDFRRPRDLAQMTVSSDSTGSFLANFAGIVDIWGSDEATMTVSVGRDTVTHVGTAIHLAVAQGIAGASGYATSFRPFHVDLVGSDGLLRDRTDAVTFPPIPEFGVGFQDTSGNAIYPRPGDRVVVPGPAGASVLIPRSELNAEVAADVVNGLCMADAPYELRVDTTVSGERTSIMLTGTTQADGTLRRHVKGNIRPGDFLYLTCSYPTRDTFSRLAHVR